MPAIRTATVRLVAAVAVCSGLAASVPAGPATAATDPPPAAGAPTSADAPTASRPASPAPVSPDGVLVETPAAALDGVVERLDASVDVGGVTAIRGETVRIDVPDDQVERALAVLSADGQVDSARVDAVYRAAGWHEPDDPWWPRQWAMMRARLTRVWPQTQGEPVRVAVLDTGVTPGGDLEGRVRDGLSTLEDGDPHEDVSPKGHGTAVTGVIAAAGDNGDAMAGVCWRCEIVPIQVLNAAGGTTESQLVEGIEAAVERDARIINLSLSQECSENMTTCGQTGPTLAAAIEDAVDAGVLVVAAGGNENDTRPRSPASHPDVLGVGALGRDGAAASYSNQGDWLDLVAGGTTPSLADSESPAPRTESGTSFAAPVVSGVAALMLGHDPSLTGTELRALLQESAAPTEASVAHGELQAIDALRAAGLEIAGPGTTREGGGDRYETALALTAERSDADTVVVATGEQFPDALSAAPLAAVVDAPLLLTPPTGDAAVSARIAELSPDEVMVVGGEQAVPADLAEELAGDRPVRRLSGATRYGTAAAVACAVGDGERACEAEGFTGVAGALVASGRGFADALAGGALAGARAAPLLLTHPRRVPDETAAAVHADRLDPLDLLVLGGDRVVAPPVADALADLIDASAGDASSEALRRVSGDDRYATAAAVSRYGWPSQARTVYLATGETFADAIGAAAAAGASDAPLLLTPADRLAPDTAAELARLRPDRLRVVGGSRAVSASTLEDAEAAADGRLASAAAPS